MPSMLACLRRGERLQPAHIQNGAIDRGFATPPIVGVFLQLLIVVAYLERFRATPVHVKKNASKQKNRARF
jgi:hypothetical protein